MVSFYLMRHPETLANVNRELWGGYEVPLSCKGNRDSYALIDVFLNLFLNTGSISLYTSPLSRCQIIASCLFHEFSQKKDTNLFIDNRLGERKMGVHTGKTKKELLQLANGRYGDIIDYVFSQESYSFESTRQIRERVYEFLLSIDFEKDTHVIFSHSSILRTMISVLTNTEEEDFEKIHGKGPRNCEIRKRTSENPNEITRNALLV